MRTIEDRMRIELEHLEGHVSPMAMEIQTKMAEHLAERMEQCESTRAHSVQSRRIHRRWAKALAALWTWIATMDSDCVWSGPDLRHEQGSDF